MAQAKYESQNVSLVPHEDTQGTPVSPGCTRALCYSTRIRNETSLCGVPVQSHIVRRPWFAGLPPRLATTLSRQPAQCPREQRNTHRGASPDFLYHEWLIVPDGRVLSVAAPRARPGIPGSHSVAVAKSGYWDARTHWRTHTPTLPRILAPEKKLIQGRGGQAGEVISGRTGGGEPASSLVWGGSPWSMASLFPRSAQLARMASDKSSPGTRSGNWHGDDLQVRVLRARAAGRHHGTATTCSSLGWLA